MPDEVMPGGPKVPLIVKPISAACRAERLARATACPNRPIVRPSSQSKGEAPRADPGEEMALCVSAQIGGVHVLDVALIYVSVSDQPGGDQVAQPLGGEWLDLVVVGAGHAIFAL